MSILSIVTPIWNEIAKCGLRTQWAKERFTLEDGDQLLEAYDQEAKQLSQRGIPSLVILSYMDMKPLLLERAAIARYKETSSGWLDHVLLEVNTIQEATEIASLDHFLTPYQMYQLGVLLHQDMVYYRDPEANSQRQMAYKQIVSASFEPSGEFETLGKDFFRCYFGNVHDVTITEVAKVLGTSGVRKWSARFKQMITMGILPGEKRRGLYRVTPATLAVYFEYESGKRLRQ